MPRNSSKESEGQGFGVFKKDDGPEITAWSVDEAVRYRFEGWQEVAPAAVENREPEPAPEADAPASA